MEVLLHSVYHRPDLGMKGNFVIEVKHLLWFAQAAPYAIQKKTHTQFLKEIHNILTKMRKGKLFLMYTVDTALLLNISFQFRMIISHCLMYYRVLLPCPRPNRVSKLPFWHNMS